MGTVPLEKTPQLEVANQRFLIEGEPGALYGGAVHYWRLDREKWSGILDAVVAMGYRMISIYIPWEVHELERGRFDFGEINPANDIDAFLSLCEEKGLRIVVRPGPQINSELTGFGYPRRILADESLHARNARGTRVVLTQAPRPIPALSYAADKFFEETALWYDAICPILARHAYPKGGLVACQVDNEMAYFFGLNYYSSDYSEASIEKYRAFLAEKYGSLAGISKAHRTRYDALEDVDPPRKFCARQPGDLPVYLDWAQYRENYLVDSIARLADMLRERGLASIPLFHNYPHPLGPGGASSNFTTPFNLIALERVVDFVGFDVYSRKELFQHVRTVTSYVSGSSRYPYIPEFIAGVWAWYLNPGDLRDEEFVTKAALMHGIKGFSRYMLVERDRWLDSPIRRDGTVREDKAHVFGQANRMLDRLDWQHMDLLAPVALLANRDYDRLEAASVLVSFPGDFLETPSTFSEYPNILTVDESDIGFQQPVQLAKRDWFGAWYENLERSRAGFVISDTEADLELLAQRRIVVLTTFEFLSAQTQRTLVDYVRQGGTLIIGPTVPTLGADMEPCTILSDALGGNSAGSAELGEGSVHVVASPGDMAAVLGRVLAGLGETPVTVDNQLLRSTIHLNSANPKDVVVFIANPTDEPQTATVTAETPIVACQDAWSGEQLSSTEPLMCELLPYTVHAFRIALD